MQVLATTDAYGNRMESTVRGKLAIGLLLVAYFLPEAVVMAEILLGAVGTIAGVAGTIESIQNGEYWQAGFRGLTTFAIGAITISQAIRNWGRIQQGFSSIRNIFGNGNRGCVGGTDTNGTLTGELNGLTVAERTMVNDLINNGNNVEIIPRSNIPGNRTPDFLVNDVLTELKTLTGTSLNTPVTRIQAGFRQGATMVIIDGRNTGLILYDANIVIERVLGIYGGEMPGTVEIWTMEGIIRR